ncbi:hypothetical protein C1637_09845 [Chryseobacterium lactis]|uniref:Uncharacterized protein n=1 Tax=Chryseobacterium lactis TaxID=1241981 RepID=A0A3G6REQ4_CHRLC|nr:hypothetical protein [Chryseobacterium lactis]AZA82187.1 hypothetical protein EG342_09855 [Chryseobacterium lactis]AZB02568.1 hypothetical protein EG341_00710 [Chryseobacterium lactis]PNW14137.1 hypothetical protein C1637_09845 [Chryseobacterium lactis]
MDILVELKYKLANFGDVISLKNDFVFTLLMRITDNSGRNINNILDAVKSYIGSEKEKIEILQNDEEYILIVLKP